MTTQKDVSYLAIHAGHSQVKVGLFELTDGQKWPRCNDSFSISNHIDFPWERIAQQTPPETLRAVLTGSNQESVRALLATWPEGISQPFTISDNTMIPVKATVDEPSRVGPDRLLNAVAVNVIRMTNQPAIIVDSGTAMTVDVVDSEGCFRGGAIAPGIVMGVQSLHQLTTTLPLIEGQEFLTASPMAIGQNTEAAMASGLYWGHVGAVKELVMRMEEEIGAAAQLFLTGGALPILEPFFANAENVPELSLIGSVLVAHQAAAT